MSSITTTKGTVLIRVTPIQYHPRKGYYVRYYYKIGVLFNNRLTVSDFINFDLKSLNIKKSIIASYNDEENLLYYQYEGKPQIILNLNDQKLYVEKSVYDTYHIHVLRNQGCFLINILNKFGYLYKLKRKGFKYNGKP